MMKADQFIAAAMHHEHRDFHTRQLGTSLVFNRGQPTHRQPWEDFRRQIKDTRETDFEDESANLLEYRQFGLDAAPQRFAKRDNVRSRKTSSPQPLISCLGI